MALSREPQFRRIRQYRGPYLKDVMAITKRRFHRQLASHSPGASEDDPELCGTDLRRTHGVSDWDDGPRQRTSGEEPINKLDWRVLFRETVAQGVKLGWPKIDSATERKVRRQLAKGVGILKVAQSLGIGTGTVQRISKELG
jgi:hypothetical protein